MKLRKSFQTLPERIFYNYLLCLSPFRPIPSGEVGEQAQAQMHALCGDILRVLYDEPALMNIRVEPDDCFELYVCNNRKPELSLSFRKTGEQMGSLYRFLCFAALNGQIDGDRLSVTLDKKQMKTAREALGFLPHVGIDVETGGLDVRLAAKKYPLVFPGMRLLASASAPGGQITGESLFGFAMGVFDGRYDYLIDRIEQEMELEPGFFAPYIAQMLRDGYRTEHQAGWCAEGPTFSFRFNNAVSGVWLCFDMRKVHQLYFQLGTQIGVKAICEDFAGQPAHIQAYLADRLTDCTDCMSCTKGGKNAKFAVEVTYNGQPRRLCPNSIWIGFQVEYINHAMMRALVDFSALQARYGVNWRKARNN